MHETNVLDHVAKSSGINGNGNGTAKSRTAPLPTKPVVLIPATHIEPGRGDGRRVEVGNDEFAANVLAHLPKDLLYRLSTGEVGQVTGADGERVFTPLAPETGMRLIDQHVRLVHRQRDSKQKPFEEFRPCTKGWSMVVIDAARTAAEIRPLSLVLHYPIYLPGFKLVRPGWNDAGPLFGGVWYDPPPDLQHLTPMTDAAEIRAVLEDLVVDFPWRVEGGDNGDANRQNYFGHMLGIVLRAAVTGVYPLHVVDATAPNAGKSLLAGFIIGATFLGKGLPPTKLPRDEEAVEKLIVSVLRKSTTLVNFDNLKGKIESETLEMLITGETFQGRLLGVSETIEAPNFICLAATSNNAQLGTDLTRRTIPCRLQSRTTGKREAFKHDLAKYVPTVRRKVIEALLGAVELWRDAGCPKGGWRLDGFEAWSVTIGGVMKELGYARWATNVDDWAKVADPHADDLLALVNEWAKRFGSECKTAGELAALTSDLGLFKEECDPHGDGKINVTSFQKRVLRRHLGLVFPNNLAIAKTKSGSNTTYRLAPLTSEGVESERAPPEIGETFEFPEGQADGARVSHDPVEEDIPF